MATLTEARAIVAKAINKITAQRVDPATTLEQLRALDAALDKLEPQLQQIEMATLDQSAAAVNDAVTALQSVTGDARLDTVAQLGQQLQELLRQLDDQHASVFKATKMTRATDDAAALPPPPVAAMPGAIVPIKSTDFAALRDEYQQMFGSCAVVAGKQVQVDSEMNRLLAGRQRYTAIAIETNGKPWYLVGIIHGMEAGYRFDRHQHNGDPLIDRTIHVPAGRPSQGQPPFTWEQSARDALQFEGLTAEPDFSLAHLLYLFEKFNGFGYRARGVPTPYLWGCSNQYTAGKFVADHVFSATAVSDQVGSAVLVKELQRRNLVA